jgi:uncharacterized protein (TIGR02588 family)
MNKPAKNALEWSVFALSALIVAATLGYLVWTALTQHRSDPELRVVTGSPSARGGVHRVPVLVQNAGNETAKNVKVEVVLLRGGREVEGAELNLLFVPRRSRHEGWVAFSEDPRGGTIRARAVSYERP